MTAIAAVPMHLERTSDPDVIAVVVRTRLPLPIGTWRESDAEQLPRSLAALVIGGAITAIDVREDRVVFQRACPATDWSQWAPRCRDAVRDCVADATPTPLPLAVSGCGSCRACPAHLGARG